jgi:hypothetical protein
MPESTVRLSCPRCGTPLEETEGTVATTAGDGTIRADIDCPECAAPLQLVVGPVGRDELGADVWLEDRRAGDEVE